MISMAKVYQGNQGYACTIGYNSEVDYLNMAYLQALSIKTTQKKITNYAVIVDEKTNQSIESKHREVFDQIIVMPDTWSFAKEWQIRNYSPWKRTIKLDADLILTNSIDDWWDYFNSYSLLFPTIVESYKGTPITSRWHRRLFDDNQLPNIYTAFYYFKDDPNSADFFETVKKVSEKWNWVASEFLIKNSDKTPRDDEIFSIAAEIYGIENCTIPDSVYPRFVHMKEVLNELPGEKPWNEQIHFENNNGEIWVGHHLQRLPFHYCSKNFAKQEVIEQYERYYRKLYQSTATV